MLPGGAAAGRRAPWPRGMPGDRTRGRHHRTARSLRRVFPGQPGPGQLSAAGGKACRRVHRNAEVRLPGSPGEAARRGELFFVVVQPYPRPSVRPWHHVRGLLACRGGGDDGQRRQAQQRGDIPVRGFLQGRRPCQLRAGDGCQLAQQPAVGGVDEQLVFPAAAPGFAAAPAVMEGEVRRAALLNPIRLSVSSTSTRISGVF